MPPEPDDTRLLSTKADDPVIGPLVAAYLGDLRAFRADLDRAAALGDWGTVYEVAHAIKGNASMYGFDALTQIAADLCTACADQPEARAGLAAELSAVSARAAP